MGQEFNSVLQENYYRYLNLVSFYAVIYHGITARWISVFHLKEKIIQALLHLFRKGQSDMWKSSLGYSIQNLMFDSKRIRSTAGDVCKKRRDFCLNDAWVAGGVPGWETCLRSGGFWGSVPMVTQPASPIGGNCLVTLSVCKVSFQLLKSLSSLIG